MDKKKENIAAFVFSKIEMDQIHARAVRSGKSDIYDLTAEEKTVIVKCGILGYHLDQVVDILQPLDIEGFKEQFETPGSEIHKLYHNGPLEYEFEIESQIIDLAQKGDKEAIQHLNDRKEYMKIKRHF